MTSKVPVLDVIQELPSGGHLYREELDTGGYVYYSDEDNSGNVREVWNTDLTPRATLMLAMADDEVRTHTILREILENAG